ncbi:MAG: hypothetical protein ACP5GS_08665, partial [Nitrososphaeria archaeon]
FELTLNGKVYGRLVINSFNRIEIALGSVHETFTAETTPEIVVDRLVVLGAFDGLEPNERADLINRLELVLKKALEYIKTESAKYQLANGASLLRPMLEFGAIKLLMRVPRELKVDESDSVERIEYDFSLYMAYPAFKAPPIFIYDEDGYVNERKFAYSLVKLGDPERLARVRSVLEDMPPPVKNDLKRSAQYYGIEPFFVPVPPLKDPELLRGIDWNALINDLINHGGAVTDQRVLLFRKATILRGLDMKANPHFIVVLPSNTGKSEWADAVGIREDKASAVSLIGTADMDGIKPGSLHGAELPFAIDQLEESGAERLLRYLLSFMESGEAVVDNAAQPFRIRGTSIIGFYANPLGDPKNDFLYLLLHLSKNPAAGRRFGLLLYDFDHGDHKVPRIQLKSRSLKEDISEPLRIFRAVEEYARKRLLRLIRNEKVWAWLATPNAEWSKYALQVIEPLRSGAYDSGNEMSAEYKLYQFLSDFITQGYVHTRGA